jgi:predicted HAD superfamily Cof-like phosphohydrolase
MQKSIHQQKIEKFMELCGQKVPLSPEIPDEATRQLRASLILEEVIETLDALGFQIEKQSEDKNDTATKIVAVPNGKKPNLIEIADGCADVSVVISGTLSSCGIPDLKLLDMVDDNNLAKFGPGGYRREDGKWIKPPNHEKPKISEYLAKCS